MERRVIELTTYPLKGARGRRRDRAWLGRSGFDEDRRFMVIDGSGTFLSQRTKPGLGLLEATLVDEGLALTHPQAGSVLLRRIPGVPSRGATIWEDEVTVTELDDPAQWIAGLFGAGARAVEMSPGTRRPVDPKYRAAEDDHVSLADGFPVLVVGSASIEAVRERTKAPNVEARRFRPNLLIETEEPFEEDRWTFIQIGDVVIDLTKPCERCEVVDLDPDELQKPRRSGHGEPPASVLLAIRQARADLGAPIHPFAQPLARQKQMFFGQNGIPRTEGWLSVSDRVVVG